MPESVENINTPGRRYKIVFIIDGLGMGGAERLMLPILGNLSKKDFEARVCVLQTKDGNMLADELRAIGVPVDLLPINHLRDLSAVPRLYNYLKEAQADLIHTQLEFSNIIGNITAKLLRKPSVCTIHTIPSDDTKAKTKLHQRLEWFILRFFCDHIITVSDESRKYFIMKSGSSSKKVSTIYNGIDLSRFINIDRDRERADIRKEFGLSEKINLLTTVAVLRPPKGIQFMIRALPAILKIDPNVYYLIVGTGAHEESLKTEAEKAGIKDRVIFAGMRKDVPRLLAASDIFVLPTLTEALPTVLAEAMASHLPIIASSVGGVPEMVENGQNGLLVEPENPDVLSEACVHLITSPEERKTLRENGWIVVSNKFNIQKQVENLKRVYLNQLNSHEK